jgi:hypothetical protein
MGDVEMISFRKIGLGALAALSAFVSVASAQVPVPFNYTFDGSGNAHANFSGVLTLQGLGGAGSQCLHSDNSGNVSAFGSDCGGVSLSVANTWTAKQTFAGNGSTTAPLNLGIGYTPSGPANGDCWGTSVSLFCQYNGGTHQEAVLDIAQAFSAKQTFATSAAGFASINIPNGATPTAPANGDIWEQGNFVWARLNGVTNQVATVQSTSWTPTVTFATPGNLNVVYGTQTGQAWKWPLGGGTSYCLAYFYIQTTTFTFTTASGQFSIQGLPYAPQSGYQQAISVPLSLNNGTTGITSGTGPYFLATGGGSALYIASAANPSLTTSNFTTGTNLNPLQAQFGYLC